jgi:transposase InsO family protein
VKWLYECFGVSKQAYYRKLKVRKTKEMQSATIKKMIEPIRKKQRRYGTEKLYLDLAPQLKGNNIKMGRDKFLTFCREHHLLVRRTKRSFITTDSKHFFFRSPNLVRDLVPTHAEQVFVSDITYIKLQDRYVYLSLVTDLYSKKIMGYKLDDNMKVSMVKEALTMALKNCKYKRSSIIHHSDRGIQYCCPGYADFAEQKGMRLSTTEHSDPYENAVAERINGILKYEFGLVQTIPDMRTAQKMVREAVEVYNKERRHRSLNMQTPEYAHNNQSHEYRSWKKLRA